MSETGLDKRLRQHSRRAGLMVGVTMALTIALCIGSFVYLYAWADPLTRDFVNASAPEPTRTPVPAAAEAENQTADGSEPAPTQAPAQTGEEAPTEPPAPTPTPNEFRATHRIIAPGAVNLRPGPAVSSGDPVAQLPEGTELQYLGETQQSQDPGADGDTSWLKFRTQDGLEGWIR